MLSVELTIIPDMELYFDLLVKTICRSINHKSWISSLSGKTVTATQSGWTFGLSLYSLVALSYSFSLWVFIKNRFLHKWTTLCSFISNKDPRRVTGFRAGNSVCSCSCAMADACRALSCWMTLFPAIKATKQGESVSATSPFAAALCLAFSQLAFSPIESLCAADTTSTFNCRCLIDAHALSNTLRWDGTIEDLKSWKQQADNGAWRANNK